MSKKHVNKELLHLVNAILYDFQITKMAPEKSKAKIIKKSKMEIMLCFGPIALKVRQSLIAMFQLTGLKGFLV